MIFFTFQREEFVEKSKQDLSRSFRFKIRKTARHQWLMPVILATQDCHSKPALANSSRDPISKNPITNFGLVEWLKVKALRSSLSTSKKKKKRKTDPLMKISSITCALTFCEQILVLDTISTDHEFIGLWIISNICFLLGKLISLISVSS
jgi:hypothetical protein